MTKKDNGQNSIFISEGFGAGLKFWLFFLLCFYFLGYPVPLSILFGAMGGLAGGFIVSWLTSNNHSKKLHPVKTDLFQSNNLPDLTTNNAQKSKFSQRQNYKNKGFFWGLFGKRKGLSKPRK